MSTKQKEPLRPADTIRDGALKATIWENQGENGVYHTTTLARTYEDRNGDLRDTNSFSGTDLLRIAELARAAYARSNDLRREVDEPDHGNAPSRSDRQERTSQTAERDQDENGGQRRTRQENFRSRRGSRARGNGRAQGGRDAPLPEHDI